MTHAARETSRSKGEPVHLFFFRYGEPAEAYFAYTDAETDIVHADGDGLTTGPVTYESFPINRGDVENTGTLDKTRLTVSLPQGTALYELFNPVPPSYTVSLIVRQGHVGESEFIVCWTGRVLGFGDTENQTDLSCEPVTTSFRRVMASRCWQYGCPLQLFSQGLGLCNADKDYATTEHTVVDVNGPIITLAADWVSAPERAKHVNGTAQWTRLDGRVEIRTILQTLNSSQILVGGVARGLQDGDTIKMIRGCDHSKGSEGCPSHREEGTMHSNINNYGGDPNIPIQNPFGVKNIFN